MPKLLVNGRVILCPENSDWIPAGYAGDPAPWLTGGGPEMEGDGGDDGED